MKQITEKHVLLQIIIEYLKGIQKPLLSNDEINALSDISVSAAVDRMHMGLMTALADLISSIIYPQSAVAFMLKTEDSKKNLPTVNNSQGLSINPIRMEKEEEKHGGDYEQKLAQISSRHKKRHEPYIATAEEENELYRQLVMLLLTSE